MRCKIRVQKGRFPAFIAVRRSLDQGPFVTICSSAVASTLISSLFLMSHRKNGHRVVVDAIAGDIAAVAETNRPFPIVLGQVIDQTAHSGCAPRIFTPRRMASPARRAASGFWRAESPAAAAGPGSPPARTSRVACAGRQLVLGSPARQPSIGFLGGTQTPFGSEGR